jgi:NAD+ synthase (glutamine-hydrolysing)
MKMEFNMMNIRVGMAQINCTVGDIKGNLGKICEYVQKAKKMSVDVLAFPELAITGYPPEDLLLKSQFIEDNMGALKRIAKRTKNIVAIIGFVDKNNGNLYNSAAVVHNNSIAGIYHKMLLPNYGVFDEKRYFQPGTEYPVFVINKVKIGVNICEDIWSFDGPTKILAGVGGARLIININASPYHAEKWKERKKVIIARAKENSVTIAYVNLVGGQDELVFDGHSMVFNEKERLIVRGKQFEEDLIVTDLSITSAQKVERSSRRLQKDVKTIVISQDFTDKKPPLKEKGEVALPLLEEIYAALVLGTRDYVHKNGFEKVIIGLSGGIDSALTAAVAVDALGKENVIGVFMPSEYSSASSKEDAIKLAKNLDIELLHIPIKETFCAYLKMLSKEFEGLSEDVTEENIQARIRGNILMALSNKFGWLLLSTGNKSETSVGYATLYGDMAGGFAVIKDVPKTLVYKLSIHRNSAGNKAIIPKHILEKEPSAELKPEQKDTDTLPPYEILDNILHAYIEEDKSPNEIIKKGYDKEVVYKVIKMVDRNEYKRRQAPPGIRITPKAFGKDRRMPITNRYENLKQI